MEESKILEKLERLEERLNKLENAGKSDQRIANFPKSINTKDFPEGICTNFDDNAPHTIINPKYMPDGYIGYVGKFTSEDGSKSTFSCDLCRLSLVLQRDTFEMCNILTAFASEERINILKSLLRSKKTAKDLMEELKFQTTGKLYHHLSFLEKIGTLRKDGDVYYIVSKYISSVLLIFTAVDKIFRDEKEGN